MNTHTRSQLLPQKKPEDLSLWRKVPFFRSKIWLPIAVSFGLHAFFAPLPIVLGILGFLPPFQFEGDSTPIEAVDAIPIEFLEISKPKTNLEEEPVAKQNPKSAKPETTVTVPAPKPLPKPLPLPLPKPKPKPKPKPLPKPKAKVDATQSSARSFVNPVAVAGSAGKLADSNANIRLLLRTSAMRGHPLGQRIGGLLQRTPQWSDFFGPAQIDPIQDIDNVLIAGPQFRDSSNIVAVVEHHLSRTRMDSAFDKLIARGGKWLNKNKRIAEARADRATRLFSAPSETIVAVVPPSAKASLAKLTGKESFGRANQGVVLQAYIVTPWRALHGTGAVLPETIHWAKIEIVQEKNGDATIHLQGEDSTSSNANKHAEWLETKLTQRSTVDFSQFGTQGAIASMLFGGNRHKLFDPGPFTVEGKLISGTIVVKQTQLKLLTDILDLVLPTPRAKKLTAAPQTIAGPADPQVPVTRSNPALRSNESTKAPRAAAETKKKSTGPQQAEAVLNAQRKDLD